MIDEIGLILTQTADLGVRSMLAASRPQRSLAVRTQSTQSSIGFTSPTTTYDRMRETQASAQALDASVQHYVVDPTFKASWTAWYTRAWRPFYDRYAGSDYSTYARLSAAFDSDEIAAQAEAYRMQLDRWRFDYTQQKQAGGSPVPPVPGTTPVPSEENSPGVAGLPWWFWTLVGAGLVGAGYYAYRRSRFGSSGGRVSRDPAPRYLAEPRAPIASPDPPSSKMEEGLPTLAMYAGEAPFPDHETRRSAEPALRMTHDNPEE